MFALEMNYCAERGIPHSEFLRWDESDRGKALAWHVEQAQRCQMCGTAKWEWEEDRHAYHVVEEICPGCEMKEYANDPDDKHPGKFATLKPKNKPMTRPEGVYR